MTSPTSNSISETLPSLACNNSKSNNQSLVTACTSGGSNEVNRYSLLGAGQGSGTGAGGNVPMIIDQSGGSEAPLGASGTLPRKQSGTSGFIRKGRPSRARIALNVTCHTNIQ